MNGKPVDRLNAEEICTALGRNVREVTYVKESKIQETKKETKIDWGGSAPIFSRCDYLGRVKELNKLKKWITADNCRVVFIQGIKGMGKINLAYQLGQEISKDFDYVVVRSLDQYQSIDELITDLLSSLNNQEDIERLDGEQKLKKMMKKLQSDRCLLILTNIDWIIENDSFDFEKEKYNVLLKAIANEQKKSCLVMTSKIKPKKIELLDSKNQLISYLEIPPLSVEAIKNIFNNVGSSQGKEFQGTERDWELLRKKYQGNLFVLENVAINIQENFSGNITNFITFGDFVFNGIEDFIQKLLENSSENERNVMYWLAIYRNPISLFELKDIMKGLWDSEILNIIKHLKSRFFLESKDEVVLIQPPMIRDYLIKQLIKDMTEEIINNSFKLLNKFPLFLPTATIKVREDQDKFIVKPILDKLKTKLHTEEQVKEHLRKLLDENKNNKSDRYLGGNLFNLLLHLGDLENKDLSYLILKNADLRKISLESMNFTGSKLSNSMFLNGFSNVISVAFSPDGKWLAIGDTNDQMYIWQVGESCPVLHEIIETNNGWVRAIAFSPDSKIITSGGENGDICLWEVETGKSIATFPGHLDRVRSLSYSANGQLYQIRSCYTLYKLE
ncbi:WD40 repeat domain-containing protein [Crocosphaera sp. Alani8]|uniref:WD40 repeat domain-containing protein n=1 Tax=Crocosphaera sp. Alani8 TaxID=3038952 RepID=UPI00313BA71C